MKWFKLFPDFFKGPVIKLDREFSESIRLWRSENYSLGVRENFLVAKKLMEARGLERLTGKVIFPKNYGAAMPEMCNFEEWPNLAISDKAREFFINRGNDFYIDVYIENLDLTYHVFRPGLEFIPFPDVALFRKTISGISVPRIVDLVVPAGIEYFRLPKEFELAGAIYINEVLKKGLKKSSIFGAVYLDVSTGREDRNKR